MAEFVPYRLEEEPDAEQVLRDEQAEEQARVSS